MMTRLQAATQRLRSAGIAQLEVHKSSPGCYFLYDPRWNTQESKVFKTAKAAADAAIHGYWPENLERGTQ